MVDIPPEIITEILYCLPARSLGRFKTVSKSWLAQISEPQFIKRHQNTVKLTRLIYDSYNGSIFTLPFNHLDDKPSLSVLFPNAVSFVFYGSCNGLVLGSSTWSIQHYIRFPYGLVILNPTTKEHIKLPRAPRTDYMCGIGYDSLTDDYKVVTVSSCDRTKCYVWVYSLRNNTWRRVMDYPYNPYLLKDCVFINGFLHLLTGKGVIVAFSLADETISEVPCSNLVNPCCKLVAFGEKLGMFVEDEVWLMNEYGVRESWSKIEIHGCKLENDNETKIFYEDGIIVFGRRNLVWVYDVERKSFREIVDTYKDYKYLFLRGAYVESLVSPKFSLASFVEDSHVEL